MDNYGHLFHRLLMLLKWSVIGYSLPTLTLYLAYYYERDKLKERLTDIFFTFYYWPIFTFSGFIIVRAFETCSGVTCHNWDRS